MEPISLVMLFWHYVKMESISVGSLTEWSTLSHLTKSMSFRLNTDEYKQYLDLKYYIIGLFPNYCDII